MAGNTLFTKHLLAAYMAWQEENTGRCHIVINEENIKQDFLRTYVRDGVLILNVASSAIRDLYMEDDHMRFSCRFGGTPRGVSLEYDDILGVVWHESGTIMPINVVPVHTDQGPGLVVISALAATAPKVSPRLEPSNVEQVEDSLVDHAQPVLANDPTKVVHLSDRRPKKGD